MPVQPSQHLADAARRQGDARVGRTVIHMDGVAVGGDGIAAREDDVAHVAALLVAFLRAEEPLIAALDQALRRFRVEKRQIVVKWVCGSGC